MGCVSSRAENEGLVARCRERKRLMKQTVSFRHQFAASHCAYINALKDTGIALLQFAQGESMVISMVSSIPEIPSPQIHRSASASTLRSDYEPRPPPPPPPRSESSPSASPSASSVGAGNRTGDPWYCSTPTGSSFSGWGPFFVSSSPTALGHEPKKRRHEEPVLEEWREEDEGCCSPSSSSEDFDEELSRSRVDDAATDCGSKAGGSVAGGAASFGAASVSHRFLQMTTLAKRHSDFEGIAKDLDDYFVKASDAGQQVSAFLETNRSRSNLETKRSFYHSPSIFSAFSWTWSSKPPLAIKYTLEPSKLSESNRHQSHCSTLERILAWEKKLYEEVKECEGRKYELDRKLELLKNQEMKGDSGIKIEKTNASIKRLQSLIMVATEAVAKISSTIVELRERELWPQLLELSEGLMHMWRSMNDCHQIQNQIVQQVKNLEGHRYKEATSDTHRQATRQLEAELVRWHKSFDSLIRNQRDYIRSLQRWIRLSLQQVGDDVADRRSSGNPPINALCEEWQQSLERLPDKVASENIKNFHSVVTVIAGRQAEEQKQKKKADNIAKILQKKMHSLSNIEQKYYSSYSLPSRRDLTSDSASHLDGADPLAEKRAEIDKYQRLVDDERANYSKAVQVTKDATLNNIQTMLPGLFQALSGFSEICMRSFEDIYNRSRMLNEHLSAR